MWGEAKLWESQNPGVFNSCSCVRVDVGSSTGNCHPGTVFLELVRKARAAWRKDLNFQQLQERKGGREGGREQQRSFHQEQDSGFLRMGTERWQR